MVVVVAKSWGEQGEEGACLGRRAMCAWLSLKSPVAAEYVVAPRSRGRLSGQQRLGESVKKTIHQDPPRPEDESQVPLQGLRIKNQTERAERGLSK